MNCKISYLQLQISNYDVRSAVQVGSYQQDKINVSLIFAYQDASASKLVII